MSVISILSLLPLLLWVYLVFAHGRFWASAPELLAAPAMPAAPAAPEEFPDVDIVVPARDEAQTIGRAIASLVSQDYAGNFRIILVDDDSSDATAECAGRAANLKVIRGQAKPAAWS